MNCNLLIYRGTRSPCIYPPWKKRPRFADFGVAATGFAFRRLSSLHAVTMPPGALLQRGLHVVVEIANQNLLHHLDDLSGIAIEIALIRCLSKASRKRRHGGQSSVTNEPCAKRIDIGILARRPAASKLASAQGRSRRPRQLLETPRGAAQGIALGGGTDFTPEHRNRTDPETRPRPRGAGRSSRRSSHRRATGARCCAGYPSDP